MNFNFTHVHLLLNHLPTVGFAVGLGLFLFSLVTKGNELKRASLAILTVIAFLTIPVYLTGNAAQEAIESRPGVSLPMIEAHQNAALLAFVFMEITGIFAWLGLWQFRRISQPTRANVTTVLVLSLITFGLMARAADIGGQIRHPEIQIAQDATEETTAAEAATFVQIELLKGSIIKSWVGRTLWLWPACETLHFIGLSLLFGVVVIVNLRMLGVITNVSFASLHRLLPWGILGFCINLLTGMLFFIGTPDQYTRNLAFHWKMVFMVLAGLNVLYFTLFDQPWAVKSGDDAPLSAKVVAVATIFLWIGVMYFGRMMPFIGNSF